MKAFIANLGLKAFVLQLNVQAILQPKKAARKAAKIFCTPRKGRLNEKAVEFLATADAQPILVDKDKQIQTYIWEGKGKTVMLAHGWESNSGRWRSYIHALRKAGFRIVAIDAPAHGKSSGKEFTALWYADSLYVACQHYQPDILIGHSAGGMASLFLLTHFQVPSIQQVVCLGAPSDVANVLEKFSNFLGLWQPTRKVLTAYFEEIFQKPVAYYSMANFVQNLKVSGIIVHDEEDKDVPFSEGEKIARNYAAAEFIRTKGLGHSLNDTQLIKQIVGKLKKNGIVD